MQFIFSLLIFTFGLLIGSFLNVVIFRLEKKETLGGRSYCPHCKHPLTWLDLIPVLSFIFLRGKCRYCRARISRQYPAVEIATGLLFLIIFNFQFSIINAVFLWYVASSLIVIFVYDLRHYLIPDLVLFPAIGITFLYRFIDNWKLIIENYGLATLLASGFFLAIYLVSRGRWMGFGDVKLAILLGLILGFPGILVGLFLSFFFGAIIGVGLIALQKGGLKTEVPFAPFLIAGTFMAMLWGQEIIDFYFTFLVL